LNLNLWKHLFALSIFKLGLGVFHVSDSASDVGHIVESAIEIGKGLDRCVDRILIGLSLCSGVVIRNKVWAESERLR
jgi:hypothetical protein